MPNWDERYRQRSYPEDPEPSPVLTHYVDDFPAGPALDVATGTGRNARFLAAAGFPVDGIDQSREGLEMTREMAVTAGIDDRLRLIQTDIPSYGFPKRHYAVITISFYRAVDRFPDIKEALRPGGYLFVEHHLRSTDPTPSGPSGDRYRFGANELLHACLDLTVLYYDESTTETDAGRRRATARIVARKSFGTRQPFPRRWDR